MLGIYRGDYLKIVTSLNMTEDNSLWESNDVKDSLAIGSER